jgi:hypothetical protein
VKRTGDVANNREKSEGRRRRAKAGVFIKAPRHALMVITENADPGLGTRGLGGDKQCLVTVDTGANLTVARPDIAAGWPESQPDQRFRLQTASGEALPILREVFLTLNLGRAPLKIWVFVSTITNVFILGVDILRSYNESVDIGRKTLSLAEEELSL